MRGKAGFLRLRRLTTVGVRCGTAIAVAVEEQARFITCALAGACSAASVLSRGVPTSAPILPHRRGTRRDELKRAVTRFFDLHH